MSGEEADTRDDDAGRSLLSGLLVINRGRFRAAIRGLTGTPDSHRRSLFSDAGLATFTLLAFKAVIGIPVAVGGLLMGGLSSASEAYYTIAALLMTTPALGLVSVGYALVLDEWMPSNRAIILGFAVLSLPAGLLHSGSLWTLTLWMLVPMVVAIGAKRLTRRVEGRVDRAELPTVGEAVADGGEEQDTTTNAHTRERERSGDVAYGVDPAKPRDGR